MFVIVATDNRRRGSDAIVNVFGPYSTEAAALDDCATMRAALPPGWTHEEYPYDYETREVLG